MVLLHQDYLVDLVVVAVLLWLALISLVEKVILLKEEMVELEDLLHPQVLEVAEVLMQLVKMDIVDLMNEVLMVDLG